MFCRIEGCERPVENKDTGLCATHGAEERKRARQASAPKKQYRIPPVSEQGKLRNKNIKKTYAAIDSSRLKNCTGCGVPIDPNGSHSHIIPRSIKPELADHPLNITYHCFDCHRKFETFESVFLKDYGSNMGKMFILAPDYFWLKILKQESYYEGRDLEAYQRIRRIIRDKQRR